MREADAEAAFVAHLRAHGWHVTTDNPDHTDVIATHPDGSRLVAEVKGTTGSPGTDVDTLYGQTLRRMTDPTGATRYAVVVPDTLATAALRVPQTVRDRLALEVWTVDPTGAVRPAP